METTKHYSVLLEESINALNIKKDGIYVDGTLGRAGHSSVLLKLIPNGHLYSVDRDIAAINESKARLDKVGSNYTLIHSNFGNLKNALKELDVNEIDGLILDLGVSSPQLDEAQRGFSYRFDAPLDMRMDQSSPLSAYDVVNDYSFENLMFMMKNYGEEPYAKQIARKIEKYRETKKIETTFELVEIIKSALPSKVLNAKGHPAKKVFQAIRIEVNNELDELKQVLVDALSLLKVNGRISVISFQSLEDRIVKETFNQYGKAKTVDKRIPMLPGTTEEPPFKIISRKPILPSEEELEENNRSHSAKLRVIERIR
ncbi:MAG: 16S rRNA (cytosine(1402)-N(4))-methyltransferase RsmH [Erysipelotrichaceae bacterium]